MCVKDQLEESAYSKVNNKYVDGNITESLALKKHTM